VSPFLEINAKGGEILSPKQKDRTTNFKKFRNERFNWCSQMIVFQLVYCDSNFFNWYIYIFKIGILL
jgi:hypothetical protein